MKKLVLAMFFSLDGYIEGPGGEFVPPSFSEEFKKEWIDHNLTNAAHLLYGRINFEFNKRFWTSPAAAGQPHTAIMNRLPKTVVSRTLSGDPGWNSTLMKGDLAKAVVQLKKSITGGDIYCFGGAGLAQCLMAEQLVDEYYMMITPNILSGGKRLFEPGLPRTSLTLVKTKTLDTGAVILHYHRNP